MSRSGLSLSLRTIVIAVVLLLLAVFVLQGFRGGWAQFIPFVEGNINSSDINTCESKVKGFCQQPGSDGKDWAARHSNCEEYKNIIDSGDTTCPLEPQQSASASTAERVDAGGGGGGSTSECERQGYTCTDPQLARAEGAEHRDYNCPTTGVQCYEFPDGNDQAVDMPYGMLLTSHRAGMDAAPENTVMAIERSREVGLHGVEIDVRPAQDGIVVFHDKTTGRVAEKDLKVASTPLSRLTEVLVREGLDRLRGEYPEDMAEIPALEEVLDRYKDTDVVFRIEFKGDVRSNEDLARDVYEMVDERDMTDQVIFMSFWGSCSFGLPFTTRHCDWEGLEAVESASNDRATTALLWQRRKDPGKHGGVQNVQELEISYALDEAEDRGFDIVVARDGLPNGLGALSMDREGFARNAENRGLDIAFMGAGWETPVRYGAEWLSTNDPERLAQWARNNKDWIRDNYDTWNDS